VQQQVGLPAAYSST